MLKKRLFYFIMTLPLIILLAISVYFFNDTWNAYQKNINFLQGMEDTKILASYEDAVLSETLCIVSSKGKINTCNNQTNATKAIAKKLMLSHDNLNSWQQKMASIRANNKKYKIDNFEKLIGNEQVKSLAKTYIDRLAGTMNDREHKEFSQILGKLSNIIYATELENVLVTYYVKSHKPVSVPNMIFWDKLVEASYFFDIDEQHTTPFIKENILRIVQSKNFQTLLNKIDEMRITILTGNLNKESKNLQWPVLLEKKIRILESMKDSIFKKVNSDIEKDKNDAFKKLMFLLALFVLSLLLLIYIYLRMQKDKKEEQELLKLVNRVHTISNMKSGNTPGIFQGRRSNGQYYQDIYKGLQLVDDKRKKAEKVAADKTHFLSSLSHEIRTPLSGIIGFSKLLKDIGASDEQKEFLSLIEGSSNKLIDIVNDILDLSKIDADKMEIKEETFNIVEEVELIVSTLTPLADQKDIELGLFIDPFLSHHFIGDATKLSQILTNLIGNAIKFTDTYGKVNVFVQSIQNNENDTQIKFAVGDTGIGLSEEEKKNIFNAFAQAKNSTSIEYGGTGLGLSISRQMVALMGSTLEVESQPNKGSTFYFSITFPKNKEIDTKILPKFSGVKIGLALPVKGINRQLDTNLEVYMKYLGAQFSIYYYDDLFEGMGFLNLPDIMIFDHHYVRLAGELEQCLSLDCKVVLLTNGTLKSRIDPDKHHFDDIILRPIGIQKCIRILRDSEENYKKEESSQSSQLCHINSFEGLSALVADDNMINRKLIKIILEKLGLSVVLTSDGEAAFETYKEGQFDIIFMDIQMPVMDGIEATQAIMNYEMEKNMPHVPIIALTANAAAGDKEKYLSEGMDDYTTKPVDIDKLKLLIAKYTASAEMEAIELK